MLTAESISSKPYQRDEKNSVIWRLNTRVVGVNFVATIAALMLWNFIIAIPQERNSGFLNLA